MELFNLTDQGLKTGAPMQAMIKGMNALSKKNPEATMEDIPGPGLHWSNRVGPGEIRIEKPGVDNIESIAITGKEKDHFVWLPSACVVRLIPQNHPENAWSLGVRANGSCEILPGQDAAVSPLPPQAPAQAKAGTTEALKWLSEGELGTSSLTLCYYTMGVPDEIDYESHPLDVDDFNRCVLFLEQVPQARQELFRMEGKSPQWSALVRNWDHLENTLKQEKANFQEKGATYHAIQTLLDPFEHRPKSFNMR